jgi:hypothetical protein
VTRINQLETPASRLRSFNLWLAIGRIKNFMAMYHFHIKSDKKPNGAKVSAIKHVGYINRERTFAHDEHWKETNKFVGNFIMTKDTPNTLNALRSCFQKEKIIRQT